jgi:hypothetical protein
MCLVLHMFVVQPLNQHTVLRPWHKTNKSLASAVGPLHKTHKSLASAVGPS